MLRKRREITSLKQECDLWAARGVDAELKRNELLSNHEQVEQELEDLTRQLQTEQLRTAMLSSALESEDKMWGQHYTDVESSLQFQDGNLRRLVWQEKHEENECERLQRTREEVVAGMAADDHRMKALTQRLQSQLVAVGENREALEAAASAAGLNLQAASPRRSSRHDGIPEQVAREHTVP
eukprot:3254455-Amphidinium_carterae.1